MTAAKEGIRRLRQPVPTTISAEESAALGRCVKELGPLEMERLSLELERERRQKANSRLRRSRRRSR